MTMTLMLLALALSKLTNTKLTKGENMENSHRILCLSEGLSTTLSRI